MKILISAGHTNVPGKDRGAAGNGFIEGDEAVKIRDQVASILRGRGLEVIEDGADGVNDPLTKAIALAKTADEAVEFHFNAGPAPASGVEVLSKPKDRKLGQKIAKAISACLSIPARGDQGWKAANSGQHPRLGFCEAGGLIVEVAFISSKSDMDSYHANFDKMCLAIADAISPAQEPAIETPTTHEFHTVVTGDTLWGIASKYGLSVAGLKKLNGLTNDRIDKDQKLRVR